MRVRLLRCLGKALVKHGARFVLNLAPGGDVLYDIAAETWEAYRQDFGGDEVAAELESLAQAAADQLEDAVKDVVRDVASDCADNVKEAISAYLTQVPASIRRSLRRPSEASGKTVPPGRSVNRAEDLAQLLPPRPPRFKPGDRPLPGVDWELEELAGVGGFGEVWKARHPYLKSKPPVALKFCLDPSATAALRNEAGVLDRVMQQGRHSGIVPLLHTYLSADPPCLEYEFVDGADLAGLIQELHARGKVMAEAANRLLVRLAEIVAFAHKAEPPIVHGDLKPANVLVRRTADGKLALRVIDFGIGGLAAARAAQEVRKPTRGRSQLLTEAVRGAHTPLYASPEQMARRPGTAADPRDDVHALGVIWYQLITGDLTITSIPPDWREQLAEHGVGEALIKLLGACVAPKADKRPASAVALVEQIQAANVPMVEPADADAAVHGKADRPRGAAPQTGSAAKALGGTTTARPPRPMPTMMPAAGKSSKKRLVLAVAGGAVLLLGVIGLGAGGLFLMNQKSEKPITQAYQPSAKDKTEGPEPKDKADNPKENPKVYKANFDKLQVGMTRKQVEDILGTGRLAEAADVEAAFAVSPFDESLKTRYRKPWSEAANEKRVQVWTHGTSSTYVLACFSRDAGSAGKVESFCYNTQHSFDGQWTEIGSLLKVTGQNFAKLTVGTTLKQLQGTLGGGRRATAADVSNAMPQDSKGSEKSTRAAWAKAASEDKVQVWQEGKAFILALFPDVPSAGSKVEVLFCNETGYMMQEPPNRWLVSKEAFDVLKVGMTLKEMDEILGSGWQMKTEEISSLLARSAGKIGACRQAAWSNAAKQEKVRYWQDGGTQILAAFTDDPAAGGKADVLLLSTPEGFTSYVRLTQKPADKWAATRENFDKLKVGMTLKDLNAILGVGPRITREQMVDLYWGGPFGKKLEADEEARKTSWEKAVKEQRVHRWDDVLVGGYTVGILAAFPETPSDATKAEAYYYWKTNNGYEHKGLPK
jgi:serine/threonine protein kinase